MPTDPLPAAGPGDAGSTDRTGLWQAWWRMFGLRAPLSGDVVQQLVDPSLLRDGSQLGFLNINATRAGDPALEQRIVTEVASYGRQLGRLIDAVGVLARDQDRDDLTVDDRHALDQLLELADQIAAAKNRAVADRIDRVVADVRVLRADPETNREALRRLREALGDG